MHCGTDAAALARTRVAGGSAGAVLMVRSHPRTLREPRRGQRRPTAGHRPRALGKPVPGGPGQDWQIGALAASESEGEIWRGSEDPGSSAAVSRAAQTLRFRGQG